MATFFALIWAVALIAIIIYTVKFIKNRKASSRKEIELKKSIKKKLYISIGVLGISTIGGGLTTPSVKKADAEASKQSSSSIDSSSSSESIESSSSSESSSASSSSSSEKQTSKSESTSQSSSQTITGTVPPAINNNEDSDQPKQSKEETQQPTTTNTNDNSQQNTTATPAQHGSIKGNINSKIYHVPGGKSYNKLSEANTVYFDSEADAQAAGYKRAKN